MLFIIELHKPKLPSVMMSPQGLVINLVVITLVASSNSYYEIICHICQDFGTNMMRKFHQDVTAIDPETGAALARALKKLAEGTLNKA